MGAENPCGSYPDLRSSPQHEAANSKAASLILAGPKGSTSPEMASNSDITGAKRSRRRGYHDLSSTTAQPRNFGTSSTMQVGQIEISYESKREVSAAEVCKDQSFETNSDLSK